MKKKRGFTFCIIKKNVDLKTDIHFAYKKKGAIFSKIKKTTF